MNTALKTHVTVPLTVPVTVPAADGRTAERSTITLRRPKVRHVKRLAALIGADVVDALVNSDAIEGEAVEGRKLVIDVVRKLLSEDRLQGLAEVVADLANEDLAVIDDIDAVDLPAVLMGFAGFFPALQSAIAGFSPAISPSSGATTRGL